MSALAPEGCFHVWPDGLHASHTCLEDQGHDGPHVCTCGATQSAESDRCPECGGTNGGHGLVHTRYGNSGGGNRPCPRSTEQEPGR